MDSLKKIYTAINKITFISNHQKYNFDERLDKILEAILEFAGAEKGSIMLAKNKNTLVVSASSNKKIVGLIQNVVDNSPSCWVLKNKKPLESDKYFREFNKKNKDDRYKKNAFLLTPVIRNNKIIGIINLTEKIDDDTFTVDEREAILNLAGFVISTIETNRLAETLKKKSQTLRKKNKELNRLERVKTEFFNMLIHDLKGPVSEVIANLDILTYTSDPENLEYVKSAQTGCDTLYGMISNLLDIARLEEGSLQMIMEKIDPEDLISEAVSRVFAQAKFKNIKLEIDVKTKKDFSGDRSLLLRVFQNLLLNAIHYSPDKSTIKTGFNINNGFNKFYVQDTGPGINPLYLTTIFDKYKQLQKSRGSKDHTVGLGLSFCKLAINAHKGEIYAESDGKKGTKFIFNVE